MKGDNFVESGEVLKIQQIIRSILISRAKEGATVQEIKDDYYGYCGEEFPFGVQIIQFLLNMDDVIYDISQTGAWIFHIKESLNSQHILNMVKKQKKSKHVVERTHMPNDKKVDNLYFKDNYRYWSNDSRHRKFSRSRTDSSLTSRSDNACTGAYLYDYQFLGDDFFLSMAKMELNCRFRPGCRVLQSGFCISGQTIPDAIQRARNCTYISPKVIVNIGSVDILHGRDLLDIKYDFVELIKELESQHVTVIVTTLAPLANSGHQPELKMKLDRFNGFLRRTFSNEIIDLWSCMVNSNGQTLYECYQAGARYVTGSSQPHVFWNKLGRQRILKLIKRAIADF